MRTFLSKITYKTLGLISFILSIVLMYVSNISGNKGLEFLIVLMLTYTSASMAKLTFE